MGDKWSASRSGPFTPRARRASGILGRRFNEHHIRFGHCGEDETIYPHRESNPDSRVVQPLLSLLYWLNLPGFLKVRDPLRIPNPGKHIRFEQIALQFEFMSVYCCTRGGLPYTTGSLCYPGNGSGGGAVVGNRKRRDVRLFIGLISDHFYWRQQINERLAYMVHPLFCRCYDWH
jgi:hypothetical protein